MNTIRAQIGKALDSLIEERNGFGFQRLACQCLHTRWPSLAATAEQADCGEDAITIVSESFDDVIRSMACSLTATKDKVLSDADKIKRNRLDIHEFIFATPKSVTRKTQHKWEKEIESKYSLKLIVVERSEFISILERPESQYICKLHLGLNFGYSHLLESAKTLQQSKQIETAIKKAQDAEHGALDEGDWETYCKAQLLLSELFLEKEGRGANYAMKALEALTTARAYNLRSLLPECLIRQANSIARKDPIEERRLLDEAEMAIGEDVKTKLWLYLNRAEMEHLEGNLNKAEEELCKWEELANDRDDVDRQSYHHLKFRTLATRGNYPVALNHLTKALSIAKLKKKWINVAWILQEKAEYHAQTGDLKRAAQDAEKAHKAFKETGIGQDMYESALWAGHLYFESHNAERALGLANYVLSRADLKQYEYLHQDALQLKTKALQVLKRIPEAQQSNNCFRELIAHEPKALILADIQDSMLYAQLGNYDKAEMLIEQTFEHAKEQNLQEEIIAAFKVNWAKIKMDQAKHFEACALVTEALKYADKLPPQAIEAAENIAKLAAERAPLTSVYENIINEPEPLKLARTEKAKSVQDAHKEIIRPLLEWTDKCPRGLQGIYDFWGRGNLTRYVLNHRGFNRAFHVTVEATNISEARHWVRVLSPLVDVLTILWKGPMMDSSMVIVPVHHKYEEPGGWGYDICAGSNCKPDENSNDFDWSPAMGWATLLPENVTKFIFEEARAFFEAGRLFLLPAPNVGCIDHWHGPLERMFNDITMASPILSAQGNNRQSTSLDSIPIPYFPNISLSELLKVTEEEGDSLLETRLALRSWTATVADRDKYESREFRQECYDRVESGLRRVERDFNALSLRLDWAQRGGSITSFVFESGGKLDIAPRNSASAELFALHSELRASPWYAYYRLSSQGYRWDLMHNVSTHKKDKNTFIPERVHHWFVPPQAGWTIPTAVRL